MKSFKQVVQSLTSIGVLEILIKALEEPYLQMDMNTYGFAYGSPHTNEIVCTGCVATNAICTLMQEAIPKNSIEFRHNRVAWINKHFLSLENEEFQRERISQDFLRHFEFAFNELRDGRIEKYNFHAAQIGMAFLPTNLILSEIDNYRYEHYLPDILKELREAIDTLKAIEA
jgi:hypothetical protein